MKELDTTLVECPNGCLLSTGFGKSTQVERQFKWHEDAKEDIGTRRYCERCGEELEAVLEE